MPASPLKGVIFDLDGTLLDTLEDLAEAMNCVLANHGWPAHPVNAYRRFVGSGVNMLVRRALPDLDWNEEDIAKLAQEMRQLYATAWAVQTRPYTGIDRLLEVLHEQKVPTAVVSNKPHDATQAMVRHFFPMAPFRLVIGAQPDKPRKPDPTTSLEAASHLRLPPQSVLFLGDSDVDMHTARAADMTPLGAGWGFRGPEELRVAGARAVLHTPMELLEWLARDCCS